MATLPTIEKLQSTHYDDFKTPADMQRFLFMVEDYFQVLREDVGSPTESDHLLGKKFVEFVKENALLPLVRPLMLQLGDKVRKKQSDSASVWNLTVYRK